MSLKATQEQQAEARNAICQLRDTIAAENRDFTADETTAWEQANAAFDAAGAKIKIFERASAVAVSTATEAAQEEARTDAKQLDLRSLAPGEGIELSLAARAPRTEAEARTMSTTTASEGGNVVATDLLRELEIAMLAYGGVREVARVLRTSSGNPIDLPTVDDTGNAGQIEGENDAVANTDMAFGKKSLEAYKVSSDLVKVPYELFADSAFNLSELLGELLGERIGRKAGELYTTGTGSSQPNGVVTASALGVTAASATALTTDELIELFHSLGRAYRRNGTFMFADSTAKLLRKLKDGDNQYLWQPGLTAGQPDQLLGRPVVVNDDIAAVASDAKSILFGDFSKYWIRDVGSIRLVRLNERFADNDQIGFIAFLRTDGELVNAGTNPVKHLVQAT